LDDTLDVFPCHGVGGICGMILTGVFAKDVGLVYGETKTFVMHLIGLVIVSAYAFVGSYLLLLLTNKISRLRVSEAEEEMGLDLSQHGESYGRKKSVEV